MVCAPESVIAEFRSFDAPVIVRQWAESLPGWLEVHAVGAGLLADPRWESLHSGERAALALATMLKPDLILIDERIGVAVAKQSGFRVTGTLGILDQAARHGILDFPAAIEKLRVTTFRYPRSLVSELLIADAARKKAASS